MPTKIGALLVSSCMVKIAHLDRPIQAFPH
jgi:hypothetical protein